MPPRTTLALLGLLLVPALAAAQARLTPYAPASPDTLKQALDPKLLPPGARLEQVEQKQVFTLGGVGVGAPLVLVPVTTSAAAAGGGLGTVYGCGLYLLAGSPPRATHFLPTYNRVPDTFGECGSLAAIALENKLGPHPRLLLVYNVYEPPRHDWQQPIVLTWSDAAGTYAVAPAMPDQGDDMSARWSVADVRRWLRQH